MGLGKGHVSKNVVFVKIWQNKNLNIKKAMYLIALLLDICSSAEFERALNLECTTLDGNVLHKTNMFF